MRTTTRFRGTVARVSFVASVDVERVEGAGGVPRAGERLSFGIHSPSRTFGPEPAVGRTFDLVSFHLEFGSDAAE